MSKPDRFELMVNKVKYGVASCAVDAATAVTLLRREHAAMKKMITRMPGYRQHGKSMTTEQDGVWIYRDDVLAAIDKRRR